MTRVATLFQTPLLRIDRFDHPRNEIHVDGQLEVVPAYRITFLCSGEFRIVRKSGTWDFVAGDMLISTPGTTQRIFHPQEGARDECIGIRFEPDLMEDALGALPDEVLHPRATASARSAFQLKLIGDAVEAQDPTMLEGIALAAAEVFVRADRQASCWNSVESSYAWYRVRIRRICDLLTKEYSRNHSLSLLAKQAQMSPFHLNRVFHYMVGVPLHQYMIRLRLAAAAKAMREGESVTAAAYSNGFNSVSFFSRSFRKHFGMSPRSYARVKTQNMIEASPSEASLWDSGPIALTISKVFTHTT